MFNTTSSYTFTRSNSSGRQEMNLYRLQLTPHFSAHVLHEIAQIDVARSLTGFKNPFFHLRQSLF